MSLEALPPLEVQVVVEALEVREVPELEVTEVEEEDLEDLVQPQAQTTGSLSTSMDKQL